MGIIVDFIVDFDAAFKASPTAYFVDCVNLLLVTTFLFVS